MIQASSKLCVICSTDPDIECLTLKILVVTETSAEPGLDICFEKKFNRERVNLIL